MGGSTAKNLMLPSAWVDDPRDEVTKAFLVRPAIATQAHVNTTTAVAGLQVVY